MDCLAFYMSGFAAGAGMTVTTLGLMVALGYIQVIHPRDHAYDIVYVSDEDEEEDEDISDYNSSDDDFTDTIEVSDDDESGVDDATDDWLSKEIEKELKPSVTHPFTVHPNDLSLKDPTEKQLPLPYKRGSGKYCTFNVPLNYEDIHKQKITTNYLATS